MYKNRDIHICILWNTALQYKEIVESQIRDSFEILKIYEIHWEEGRFGENLTSLYEENFRINSWHIKERGIGPFLVYVVEDHSPNYFMQQTRRGLEDTNEKAYYIKQKIRSEITHTYNFHTSINEFETRGNIVKLLGVNLEDFLERTLLDGSLEVIYRNCAGVGGWKSLNELFYVLNECCVYTVLRTFEALPLEHRMDIHGDIDLLVQDLPSFLNILQPDVDKGDDAFRFFNWMDIGDQHILIHPKYVGDHYYDRSWQQKILDTRYKNANGIYVPNTEMYFWSLLYHGLFHKENYEKYISIFQSLAVQLGIEWRNDKNYLCTLLSSWLIDNHYECQLHLDGAAAVLQPQNFRLGMTPRTAPVIYVYKQYFQNRCYSISYISEELIRYNSKLFTSLVRPLDSLLALQRNVLRNDSTIYHEFVTRQQKGELFWKYSVRMDDVSEMVYTHIYGMRPKFEKHFLSGNNQVSNDSIICCEEKNIPYIEGVLEVDHLMELSVLGGIEAVQKELCAFIETVFVKFAKDDKHVSQNAWDAMPKNCFFTEDGSYQFFDLEMFSKAPIKKSSLVAQVVRQTCDYIGYDKDVCTELFETLCRYWSLDHENLWGEGGTLERFTSEVLSIIVPDINRDEERWKYYFAPALMDNKLITVPLETFVLRDEYVEHLRGQIHSGHCREHVLQRREQELLEEVELEKRNVMMLRQEINDLRNSTSCRLGFVLTWPLRKIKDCILNVQGHKDS